MKMLMFVIVTIMAATMLFLAMPDVSPAMPIFGNDVSSLRCGGGLVVVGDYPRSVVAKCGIPQRETFIRPARIMVYHFGPSRFLHYLSIVDGRVNRIQTGLCDGDNPDCDYAAAGPMNNIVEM